MRHHSSDQLEAINAPQLVTATDRLLVLGLPRKRQLARGSCSHIEVPTVIAIPVRPRRRALGVAVVVLACLVAFTTTRIAIAQHDATQISHR